MTVPMYNDGLFDEANNSPGYKRLWSTERLKAYRESFKGLKGNAQVCAMTVCMGQNMLLTDRSAMDHILAKQSGRSKPTAPRWRKGRDGRKGKC